MPNIPAKSSFSYAGPPGVGKRLGVFLLSVTGACRLAGFLSSHRLSVLTYHSVIPRARRAQGPRPPNTLFDDEFEKQMAFVSNRFTVLSGNELRTVIDGGGAIPRYSLVITFDDGYENNFSCALPVLKRYGLHAVFFITTNLIGHPHRTLWFDRLGALRSITPSELIVRELRRIDPAIPDTPGMHINGYFKTLAFTRQSQILDELEQRFGRPSSPIVDQSVYGLMNWDQVRSMAAAGMTIGSHTANHQILSAVSPAEVQQELRSSRQRIEQETGEPCWCFAYPNGERRDFRPSDECDVERAGYLCAFTQISGVIDNRTSRYALPRIPIPDTGDMNIFRMYVSGIHRAFSAIVPGR